MILFPRPTSRFPNDADSTERREASQLVEGNGKNAKKATRERRTLDDQSNRVHDSSLVDIQRSTLVLEPIRESLLLLLKLLDRLVKIRGLSLVLVARGRSSFLVRIGFGELGFHLLMAMIQHRKESVLGAGVRVDEE